MRLKKGDRIGVVSPSAPVAAGDDRLGRGANCLERMGFSLVLGQHVHSNTLGYAASPQDKAADLNGMFADPSIHAIVCAQGGHTANACLPYLDWQTIAHNPKVFMGMSDITVLLNPIYARTGLITFHGNDVMWGFGSDPAPYDIDEFAGRLMAAGHGPVAANGPRQTVRGGAGEGILLGGNLGCLLKLAGTPFFPDLTGAILFLEAYRPRPEACDVMLCQLQQSGAFDRVQGVLIGYIDGLDNDPDAATTMQDILLNLSAGYDFPILKVSDFGHNCPNTVLPVGARVRLDADEQAVEILEACVE